MRYEVCCGVLVLNESPVKNIAWNIARRAEAWQCLADCDADIGLLQEAAEPPADLAARFEVLQIIIFLWVYA